jgi:hypothetical protein
MFPFTSRKSSHRRDRIPTARTTRRDSINTHQPLIRTLW